VVTVISDEEFRNRQVKVRTVRSRVSQHAELRNKTNVSSLIGHNESEMLSSCGRASCTEIQARIASHNFWRKRHFGRQLLMLLCI